MLEAMYSRPDGSDGRESRRIFVAITSAKTPRVEETTGWSCPNYTDMWWCPDIGFSYSIGHGAFFTRREAENYLVGHAKQEMVRWAKVVEYYT